MSAFRMTAILRCFTISRSMSLPARPSRSSAPPAAASRRSASSSRAFTTSRPAKFSSTDSMCAASRRGACAGISVLYSRTCSCSPIRFWRTSATASPTRRWMKSWRPRSARRFTTTFWPCQTASTPTSANAARSFPVGRSSAFRLPAFSAKIRRF